VDRQKVWRIVANNYRSLEANAPDGQVPVVEVFLAGRAKPIVLGHVETDRDPAFPWTLFSAKTKAGGEGDTASTDAELVLVPEQYIERIELRYARSGAAPVGFSHGELSDPSSAAE
jgi:hypothetical protein